MKTFSFDNYKIILDDPIPVISGGTYEEHQWGPYQFPGLGMTRNGHIILTCTRPNTVDDINGYEANKGKLLFGKVSEDGGATWREIRNTDIHRGTVMANGREYRKPANKNAYTAPWLDKYKPVFDEEGLYQRRTEYYYAAEIPEFPANPEAYEYDPATGKTESFKMQIEWPNLTVRAIHHPQEGRLVYPMEMTMGAMGDTMADPDGTLFFCTYGNGCSAETGKPKRLYIVTVLRSDDGGRHWKYQSEITHPLDTDDFSFDGNLESFCEGFCEPMMTRMPDGSVIMLMRTCSGKPSYITRSTDNCRTWSEPVVFDHCGVYPRLLTMPCGVTLASYGRPGVFLRSTSDKAGLVWDAPIDLGINDDNNGGRSCCYTRLLPLDDTTAMVAYSHFYWPNSEGVPVKTILVRKIHIEKEK